MKGTVLGSVAELEWRDERGQIGGWSRVSAGSGASLGKVEVSGSGGTVLLM